MMKRRSKSYHPAIYFCGNNEGHCDWANPKDTCWGQVEMTTVDGPDGAMPTHTCKGHEACADGGKYVAEVLRSASYRSIKNTNGPDNHCESPKEGETCWGKVGYRESAGGYRCRGHAFGPDTYVEEGTKMLWTTPRGKRLKELRDKIPEEQKGRTLEEIGAGYGDEMKRAIEREQKEIPVRYPEGQWRTMDDPDLCRGLTRDIWLYYPKRDRYVALWHNWIGFQGDAKQEVQEGATHWCPAKKPLPPNE